MKLFYKKILTIGVASNYSKEHKTIKLLNAFMLYWIIAIIPISIMDYFLVSFNEFMRNISIYSIGIAILFLVFFLQHKSFLILARVLFILCFLITICFFCLIDSGRLLELFFILTPLATLILIKNKWINIGILILSFLCHVLLLFYVDAYNNLEIDPTPLLVIFMAAYLVLNYSQNLNRRQELTLAKERDNALSDKIILEKQEIQLRELNEFKSHFFVNLSHEIRTPITLIKGYTSKIKLAKHDKNNQNLNVVNAQIKQIETILNNILDLSKLDANKLRLEKTPTELTPFLNKHFADFKEFFFKKRIRFHLNNTIEAVKIDMDANLIAKSINNILSNTLKFTPKNGHVHIDVTLNNNLEIAFIDNGIGIPNKDLDKIFDRFYQSKNDVTLSQGSGIGLSFTKSILDAHGFSIHVKSEPNVKTEFIITIPEKYIINNTKSNNIFTVNSTKFDLQKEKIRLKKKKNKPTILVVDDHEQMRSYLKSLLTNYNVLQAENGADALHVLNNESIDLLLTDYMMPIMNGEELVKNVKKLKLKIPVIIITARLDRPAKLNMLRIGIDGYLNKPFLEEELLLFVRNSLKAFFNIIDFDNKLNDDEKKEINEYTYIFNRKISTFINNNISENNFGVQDVADYFEVSKSTLNRKVKSILGQTTQQLIIETKIQKAKELQLKNENLTQKEIAKAVGISNSGHLFKKIDEFYDKQ